MDKIIAFRVRPPYKSFQNLSVFGARLDAANRPAAWVADAAPSVRARSMPAFLDELSEAGISHAVVWGRAVANPKASTATEDVAELVDLHAGLFSGFGGVIAPSTGEQTSVAMSQ